MGERARTPEAARRRRRTTVVAVTVATVALVVLVVPPLIATDLPRWTLVATFASAMGTSAVATATALSLRQSQRSLDRLEGDRVAEETRRLAVLEREQVLEAARAWEVILAMRGHQARFPLQSSLGEAQVTAKTLDISATQLALELTRAIRELRTALYALPEERLPVLRGLDVHRASEVPDATLDAVRSELRAELKRLTLLAAVGREQLA
jgi:hypothetical protein